MPPLGVDPKVDFAFKKLFGSVENKDLLLDLIMAVTGYQFADCEILNPFNLQEYSTDKLTVLDVKARFPDGQQVNIEVQMEVDEIYTNRVMYYWARLYCEQLLSGDDYSQLCPTFGIHFLNGQLYRDTPRWHTKFDIRAIEEPQLRFTDHLELHIIELRKFHSQGHELQNKLDQWVYFLRHGELLEAEDLPDRLQVPNIHRAVEVLTKMTQQEKEYQLYEAALKAKLDAKWKANMYLKQAEREIMEAKQELVEAKQELVEAKQEILDEGMQLGKQEGMQLGKQEGQRQGLLMALDAMLPLRFPGQSAELYVQVQQIEAVPTLEKLLQMLKVGCTIEAFQVELPV